MNFEHAWGDGVAVMRFFNEASIIIDTIVNGRCPFIRSAGPQRSVRKRNLLFLRTV